MNDIFIRDLMSKDVKIASPDAPLTTVLELMREHVHSCIVIAEAGAPVGIITERDLVGVLISTLLETPEALTSRDIMSSPPICLTDDSTLYEALVVTQTRSIRHIPIIDKDNRLRGIITQTDIAQAHFLAVEKQRELIEQQISHRTQELEQANQELKALALQDGLLGIGNRRAMEVDLQYTHANAVRYHHPYTVALLDVDFFKRYNDRYGHPQGDKVLKQVSRCIQSSVRSNDRVYRYGGEEFLILMADTQLPEATMVTERVLAAIEALAIESVDSPFNVVTVSGGLAAIDLAEPQSWKVILDLADKQLYSAKDAGRNRVAR